MTAESSSSTMALHRNPAKHALAHLRDSQPSPPIMPTQPPNTKNTPQRPPPIILHLCQSQRRLDVNVSTANDALLQLESSSSFNAAGASADARTITSVNAAHITCQVRRATSPDIMNTHKCLLKRRLDHWVRLGFESKSGPWACCKRVSSRRISVWFVCVCVWGGGGYYGRRRSPVVLLAQLSGRN